MIFIVDRLIEPLASASTTASCSSVVMLAIKVFVDATPTSCPALIGRLKSAMRVASEPSCSNTTA